MALLLGLVLCDAAVWRGDIPCQPRLCRKQVKIRLWCFAMPTNGLIDWKALCAPLAVECCCSGAQAWPACGAIALMACMCVPGWPHMIRGLIICAAPHPPPHPPTPTPPAAHFPHSNGVALNTTPRQASAASLAG